MDCLIIDGKCDRCGKPARNPKIRRNCSGKPGWGDLVERALSAVGITKKRVEKIVGKPCGCGKRQEALNRLGRKITG
jgi:hypothetical protein